MLNSQQYSIIIYTIKQNIFLKVAKKHQENWKKCFTYEQGLINVLIFSRHRICGIHAQFARHKQLKSITYTTKKHKQSLKFLR